MKMTASSFSYSGTELDALVEAKNYYRWILNYFAPYLGRRVIEVGAGLGTFSRFLLDFSRVCELIALEPADNLFPLLEQRFREDRRVRPLQGYLEDYAASLVADSVVLVNVLEHIADDAEFLRLAYEVLLPGGTVLVFTPALPPIYGSLDRKFEHHRRYTRAALTQKLAQAGLHLECLRYFNLPGLVTWFLAGKVLRRDTIKPVDVRFYDRWVVPCASKLERLWEPPLGQSLLAVARKPAGQT